MKLIKKTYLAVAIALLTLTACEKDESSNPIVDYREMDCKTHLFEATNASGIIWKLNGIKQDASNNKYEFIAEVAGTYEITGTLTSATGTEETLISRSIIVDEICFDDEQLEEENIGEVIGNDNFKVERIDWDCKTFIYESFMHDDVHWMIEGDESKTAYGSEYKFVADKPGIYILKAILENSDYPSGLVFYDTIEVKEDCMKGEIDYDCEAAEMHVIQQECGYYIIESNRPENVFYTINDGHTYHNMETEGVIGFRPDHPGAFKIRGFYENESCPMGKEMIEEIYVDESCFTDHIDHTDGTMHEEKEETTYDCDEFEVKVIELSCNTFVFESTKSKGVYWSAYAGTYQYEDNSQVFDFQAPTPGTYEIRAFYENEFCPTGKEFHKTIEVTEHCFK